MNKPLNILGLMSGSSCDGLDVALCEMHQNSVGEIEYNLLHCSDYSFSDLLTSDLKSIATKSIFELKQIESRFSNFVADCILDQINKCGNHGIDYIANHGHTVVHHPEDAFSFQLGNSSLICAKTQLPVISDFRSKDMAAGGQGAPLAPLADKYLLKEYDFYVNLGGIANIGYINDDNILGFDICPCNQVLDAIANSIDLIFDESGEQATIGKINQELIDKASNNEYLKLPYPKSIDNSWVYNNYTQWVMEMELSAQDKLRSFVEFIAIAISQEVIHIAKLEKVELDGKTLVCTGGGAYNKFLIARLQSLLQDLGVRVVLPSDEVIKYKEAMLMSLMGYLRVYDKPNCIASVTGASKDVSGGVIYYP